MHYCLCENGELQKEVLLLVYCLMALRATTLFRKRKITVTNAIG